jgi:hypothetical protein
MGQRPPLCAVSTELNLVIRRPLLFGKTMAGGDAVTVDDARSVLRSPKLPRCPIVGSEIAVSNSGQLGQSRSAGIGRARLQQKSANRAGPNRFALSMRLNANQDLSGFLGKANVAQAR